jgi:SWIM zinc finger
MSAHPSDHVAERAQDLLAENRVVMTSPSTAVVASASGATYTVTATFSGLRCSCPARIRCAHVLAAAARWAER